MQHQPKHIKFKNHQNPRSGFDLVRLETLFSIDQLDHAPDQIHLVEFYLLLFVEEGRGVHTIDFNEYGCKKGTILTIRKDQIHRFHRQQNFKGSLLLFTDDFLVSYLEQLEAQKALQLFNELLGSPKIQLSKDEFIEVEDIINRITKEYFKTNDAYSLGIIRSELHILIAKLYRIKARNKQTITHRKYLNEFIDFQSLVEQHASKVKKVQEYAKMMGVSTKTLNNITQMIVNKTAKEFVDEICTKQIKRLLINTPLSVKEIAYASGFEEVTNFYKYFKRQTQITPEQFRTTF